MRRDRPPGRDGGGGNRTVSLTPGNRLRHLPTAAPPSAEVMPPSVTDRAERGPESDAAGLSPSGWREGRGRRPADSSVNSLFTPGAPRGLAALLALSDERDLWLRRTLDAWRAGYEAAIDDAVTASLARVFPPPGHVTEAEKRRYPPDGRDHFADPRPGDFEGRRQP